MVDFAVHGLVDNSYFVIDLAIIFCVSFALLEILRREALAAKSDNEIVYKENFFESPS